MRKQRRWWKYDPIYLDRVRQAIDFEDLLRRYIRDLSRSGAQLVGHCCFHEDRRPSFSADPVRKVFFCFGCRASGSLFTFLMRVENLRFREAVARLARESGVLWNYAANGTSSRKNPSADSSGARTLGPAETRRRGRALRKVWSTSALVTEGDAVDLYLAGRGLRLPKYPEVLRFHAHLPYFDEGGSNTGYHPAMLARVDNPQGCAVSIHRTFLAAGGRKARVARPKKLMPPHFLGSIRGAAIRLFPAGKELIVAEGIETSLAAHIATGIPAWATISAHGMENIVLPESVEWVYIAADHDRNGRGERAAKVLARRLLHEGRHVKILIPEKSSTDWADHHDDFEQANI